VRLFVPLPPGLNEKLPLGCPVRYGLAGRGAGDLLYRLRQHYQQGYLAVSEEPITLVGPELFWVREHRLARQKAEEFFE
jgi:hypothetical protein